MNPLAVLAGGAGGLLTLVPVLFGAVGPSLDPSADLAACTATSTANSRGIPARYLNLYQQAGQRYGIPWQILAGIGDIESGHGTNAGTSSAGAQGPMQFLPTTWASYGVDGNNDGRKDITDPADAIPAAARYLKANGAPTNPRGALWHYNHDWGYVNNVLDRARRYAGGTDPTTIAASAQACAAGIAGAPNATAARLVAFVKAHVGDRYVFGGNGPHTWDCSGLTQAAYRSIGVTIPRKSWDQFHFGPRIPKGHEQPGDLVFFYDSPDTAGPDKPGHVGMVIGGGHHINARCTACRPGVQNNSYTRRTDIAGFTRPLADPTAKKQLTAHRATSAG